MKKLVRFMHDFHATCEKNHKRNFVFYTDNSDEKLTEVVDYCVFCEKQVKFTVKKYWKEPVDVGL